ncbi:MAG: response regulator [bacterium]
MENNVHSGQVRNILVMDDERTLRKLSVEFLTSLGYRVSTAADGTEAICKYQEAKKKAPFDVVIMDLNIPNGMGGTETLDKLREFDPDVKAVACSGESSSAVLADYQNYGFHAAVAKPFQLDNLSDVLSQLLNVTESDMTPEM